MELKKRKGNRAILSQQTRRCARRWICGRRSKLEKRRSRRDGQDRRRHCIDSVFHGLKFHFHAWNSTSMRGIPRRIPATTIVRQMIAPVIASPNASFSMIRNDIKTTQDSERISISASCQCCNKVWHYNLPANATTDEVAQARIRCSKSRSEHRRVCREFP